MTQKPRTPPIVKMNFNLPSQGAWRTVLAPARAAGPAQLATLFAQGRYPEVEAGARALVAREPRSGIGWKTLSAALLAQNKPALEAAQKAAELLPQDAQAICNLGNALDGQGQRAQAIRQYRRALELQPTLTQGWMNLGATLREQGEIAQALDCFRQVLRLVPRSAEAHNLIGLCQAAQGLDDAALGSYRRALDIEPGHAFAMVNMGKTLMAMHKPELAATAFERAAAVAPDLPEAHEGMCQALSQLQQHEEALKHALTWSRLRPDSTHARGTLGAVRTQLGFMAEGIADYEAVLAMDPNDIDIIPNLVFTQHYLPEPPHRAMFDLARRYGQGLEYRATPFTAWSTPADPSRPLRIGFVSPDLNRHPVGYFLENVLGALTRLHGSGLRLCAYHVGHEEDDLSERLKPRFAQWLQCSRMSKAALAQRIHQDAIDILIDLTGYTAKNRLATFADRPAPVQVSWLGYFATTGLTVIDHVLGDSLTALPEQDEFFTEHLWRMPHTRLCFTPPEFDVPIAPPPARDQGFVTFGSFNNLAKLNDAVLSTWARILLRMPDSRLLIKAKELRLAPRAQQLTERFQALGVNPERLHLEAGSRREDYLSTLNQVDIVLDPFPYPGGTTTAESLWMGVPVLTLAGQTMLSRQGLGLLVNAGLPDWVAHSTDEYVNKAVAFASDLDALARLRQGLRAQVLASPVFDADRFADDLNEALRGMWQRWCESQQTNDPAMP